MELFILLCFRLEIQFSSKFVPKTKIYVVKVNLSSSSDSNMQNWLLIFNLSIIDNRTKLNILNSFIDVHYFLF